eukprot:CAMPEP_0179267886 /NCGR_PEP_ID=MMETSP0797-20121207/30159_1 /TAXON_ID=47934 /ORGANISM="Dinophysis acuminata, Strain DAEP01" /LENGTH=146 /DNA_ID=CAMNT_0020976157 /DNA_START=136 /DNA_END=573 /DNA_ORIENTATION=-
MHKSAAIVAALLEMVVNTEERSKQSKEVFPVVAMRTTPGAAAPAIGTAFAAASCPQAHTPGPHRGKPSRRGGAHSRRPPGRSRARPLARGHGAPLPGDLPPEPPEDARPLREGGEEVRDDRPGLVQVLEPKGMEVVHGVRARVDLD